MMTLIFSNSTLSTLELRKETCVAIAAMQYRKDGSERTCYGCTASDHDAYHCVKLKTLSNHGLF